MILFFSITFLFTGIACYFWGVYVKKNPTFQIEYHIPKNKISPQTTDLYKIFSAKIAKAAQVFGLLCIIFVFVLYFAGSLELFLALLFVTSLPVFIYYHRCRKILTGKI